MQDDKGNDTDIYAVTGRLVKQQLEKSDTVLVHDIIEALYQLSEHTCDMDVYVTCQMAIQKLSRSLH